MPSISNKIFKVPPLISFRNEGLYYYFDCFNNNKDNLQRATCNCKNCKAILKYYNGQIGMFEIHKILTGYNNLRDEEMYKYSKDF